VASDCAGCYTRMPVPGMPEEREHYQDSKDAIGVFVGIDMLLNDWSLVMLNLAARKLLSEGGAG
jgi:hypothetical protein